VLESSTVGLRNSVGTLLFVACTCLSLAADNVKTQSLPRGVLKALAADEKEYCDQFLGDFKMGCKQKFRANLLWRQLPIAPSGQVAILVENDNIGFCGSAGCSLDLFVQQPNAKFVQVLGKTGDVGTLDRVAVLKTVSAGYYNIQITWTDGKTQTIYRWDGQRYSSH
jgi:hypothetical protein